MPPRHVRLTGPGWTIVARVWCRSRTAPPVVLVPGFVVSGAYAVPTAERLAGTFRVYAPDLPGFGRSRRPGRVLSVTELADCLRAWLRAAGAEGGALLANSFGCQIAAALAARHPGAVRALVLTSPTVDPAMRSTARLLRPWLSEASTQSWRLRRILARDYLRAGPRRPVRLLRHALADAIEERLPHVTVPTLVVRGTADPFVSPQWAARVAGLAGGRLVEVDGGLHAMVHESPDALVDVALPFLTEHLGTERRS
ncbi:alpha/beta fold hydrolase [Streptomyces sp. TRM64462]|uniref:alpha/beta fold hydrolase n=1 Tax=Streptomyces sp. TRM64462 TaxID=2741726 RepID=UPI0015863C98|nr:alpha/beta fold hydrolase [Streptomyces sp. TRM64462]